jgi:hypothetical protein
MWEVWVKNDDGQMVNYAAFSRLDKAWEALHTLLSHGYVAEVRLNPK